MRVVYCLQSQNQTHKTGNNLDMDIIVHILSSRLIYMDNCIFCKIANGELKSYTIFENKDFRVILDISPVSIGHCLIIPKNHYKNIFEIDEQTISDAFKLAKKISDTLKMSFDIDGINILQNNGEASGQTIDHFHIHIISRKKNDNVKIFSGGLHLSEEEFENIQNTIIKNI